MASLKTILSQLLRTQNPSKTLKSESISSIFPQRLNLFPIPSRPFSTSPEFDQTNTKPDKTDTDTIKKKPLHVFFKEAVGIVEKTDNLEWDCGKDFELKKRLKKLEDEIRSIKEQRKLKMKEKSENGDLKESKKRNLVVLSGRKDNKDGENLRKVGCKELSPDMIMFVDHLYRQGYFKGSNFLRGNKLVIGCFENEYARDFVVFAAEQFGKDNQEIAKWLSASDLKKVALFGCPSLAKKNVFAAKRLRTFFRIQEDTVCDKCALKKSCEFVNQGVWKGDTKALNLADIMRVITVYALESVPSELVVTEEMNSSVSKLLKEAANLSKTVRNFL